MDSSMMMHSFLELPEFDENPLQFDPDLEMSDMSSRLSCSISGDSGLQAPSSPGSEYVAIRRQSHCAIEKRRRDKLNFYIMELAKLMPNSLRNGQKTNKLNVLKQTVKHIRHLKTEYRSLDNSLLNQIIHNKAYLVQLMLNVSIPTCHN